MRAPRCPSISWLCLLASLLVGCLGAELTPVQDEPTVRTPGGTGGVNHASVVDRPYVVLVSFDGFRHDYLARFDTPSFDRLGDAGARADGLIPVFPSLTFPAHYSIATGLYPERHGIVGNRFYDPIRDQQFNYRDREDSQEGSWWGGEPIWLTTETQGMVAAAMFFPGTEAAIGGLRPSLWRPYDGGVRNAARVRQVLDWLALPAEARPHLVTLYFSLVDSAGHAIGPDAPGMGRSVEAADGLLGQLVDGIAALPHGARVILVVVSDHGMAALDPERRHALAELMDLDGIRAVTTGLPIGLHVADVARRTEVRDTLNEGLRDARAYLREEVPARLHYRASPRIGDVVVIPDEGATVQVRRSASSPRGMHGWDPHLPSMHGIFLAAGPGIVPGTRLTAAESVDVYPLLVHLLGLTPPADLDGSLDALAGLLSPKP